MTMAATRGAPGRTTAPGHRARRSVSARRENREGLALISPAVVITLAIVVVPLAWNVVLAFQDTTFKDLRKGRSGSFTLENFTDVITGSGFWHSIGTTLVYSVGATLGSIAVGLLAALAFRRPFRGRGPLRAVMLLPYVAPVVAVAFVWEIMLNPTFGIVNEWGQSLLGWDRPIDFLGRAPYAILTVIVFEIWRYFPFAFMFLSARVVALPRDTEEAALVDGATPTQTFRHITLPQLIGTIALLSVLRLIMTFNKFDDVYLLTGGSAGTEVAAVRVYDQLMGSFDIGGAAATAMVLAVILGLFLLLYLRLFGRKGAES